MGDSEKISQAYIQKLFEIQKSYQSKPLTEEEMKQVAMDMGMTEADWTAIQESFQAHLDRGEGFLKYGNWEDAIKELEQAVTINPHHVRAMSLLARSYQSRWKKYGKIEDALRAHHLAQRCIESNPGHDEMLKLISELKKNAAFRKELDLLEEPSIAVTEEEKPAKPFVGSRAYYLLAFLAIVFLGTIGYFFSAGTKKGQTQEKGNYQRGYEEQNQNNGLNESKPETQENTEPLIESSYSTASEYFAAANKREEAGDNGGALEYYNKAIEMDSRLTEAYLNRGSLQYKLEYYQAALADFDKVIQLSPTNQTAFFNRGITRSKIQDFEAAIQDYDRAIQINPAYSEAYLNRGSAKFSLDDKKGACADWRKALELGARNATENLNQYCN